MNTESDEYNGFPNQETWIINLWIGDDDDLYQEARDFIVDAYTQRRSHPDKTAALADDLQSMFGNIFFEWGSSWYSDLLAAALNRVNWYELAHRYLTEYTAGNW